MEKNLPKSEEEVLKLRALKKETLSRYPPEVRKRVDKIIEELVVESLFEAHMALHLNLDDPSRYSRQRSPTVDESLSNMAEQLNINRVNQDVECPKCHVHVKCLWLSKHLAVCMNPQQNTYSYSSRNSSRIARQRIQEGFRSSNEESRIEIDDSHIRSKKRNKSKKNKIKTIR